MKTSAKVKENTNTSKGEECFIQRGGFEKSKCDKLLFYRYFIEYNHFLFINFAVSFVEQMMKG